MSKKRDLAAKVKGEGRTTQVYGFWRTGDNGYISGKIIWKTEIESQTFYHVPDFTCHIYPAFVMDMESGAQFMAELNELQNERNKAETAVKNTYNLKTADLLERYGKNLPNE